MIPTDRLARYRVPEAEALSWSKVQNKDSVASIYTGELPFRRRKVRVTLIQRHNGYAELSVSGRGPDDEKKRATTKEIRAALTALGVRKLRRLALLPGSLVTCFEVEADG